MKTLIFIASAALILSSCKQEELDRSNQQKDSLMSVLKGRDSDLSQRDANINEFISSFNEVERNLDSISVRQRLITSSADKSRGEFKASQKDRINSQIQAINNLVESNQKTIADLKRKLKGSSRTNAKLQETIKILTEQMAQKDMELAALNEKLSALDSKLALLQTSVDSLTVQNNTKSLTITENTAALHTAFYTIGRSKDLRALKIIDRKGGLLGIGKTSKLNNNFDRSKFTRIDYTQTSSIPVNSEKVKIITSHPSDSYKLDTDAKDKDIVKNIIITDPERFWSVSKYLVVEGSPVKVENAVSEKPGTKEKNY